VLVRRIDQRNPLRDFEPVPLQPHDLARIVGDQPDLAQPEVAENLRADPIIPQIGREPQMLVRLHGVHPRFLERIGVDLTFQADAPPLLPHVKNDTPALAGHHVHGPVKLSPAVATQRAEDIAGQALAVDADHDRRQGVQFTDRQRDVVLPIDQGAVELEPELSVVRGQFHGADELDQFLRAPPIGDQIRHAGHLQAVFRSEVVPIRAGGPSDRPRAESRR